MEQNKGLDKKQLISFFVFSMILMGFLFYFQTKDQKEEAARLAKEAKTAKQASGNPTVPVATINPAVAASDIQKVNLKNDELNLEFSSLGGQISSVELLKYKAYNTKTDEADLPLNLFSKNNSTYGFQFKDKTGKIINTKDLVFTPVVEGNKVTLSTNINGAVLQFIYTLLPKYTVDFKVNSKGLSQVTADNHTEFSWDYQVRGLEKGRAQEEQHTEFGYAFDNYSGYDYDGRNDMDETKETLNWLAVKQQFFTAVIEPKSGFTQSKGKQEAFPEGEYLKKFDSYGSSQLQKITLFLKCSL